MTSLHHTSPSYDFDLQAEEFCHNWEAGIRNAVSHDRLLVLQVMVSLLSIIFVIGPLEKIFHFSCPGWRRVGGAVFLPP